MIYYKNKIYYNNKMMMKQIVKVKLKLDIIDQYKKKLKKNKIMIQIFILMIIINHYLYLNKTVMICKKILN